MKRSLISSLKILLVFMTLSNGALASLKLPYFPLDLIYGKDDRIEIDHYDKKYFRDISKSIAIRVSKKKLTVDRFDENRILFPNISLIETIPDLCPKERFIDQVSLGKCSGFLAGPRTLVTAGHCIPSEKECLNNQWVFGFKEGVTELTKSQVYSCKSITAQKYVYTKDEVSDYAVIELDRDVEGFTPLKMRKIGRPFINTKVLVIGHPLGLPMKITDGATVKRMNDLERESKFNSLKLRSNYFIANIDSYGGSSGAPVFNQHNGQVEGILIQGAKDFNYNPDKDCLESNSYSDSHLNSYEKVMRITKIPGLKNH